MNLIRVPMVVVGAFAASFVGAASPLTLGLPVLLSVASGILGVLALPAALLLAVAKRPRHVAALVACWVGVMLGMLSGSRLVANDTVNALLAGAQVADAIEDYIADSGDLPSSLDSLVPEYLAEVPMESIGLGSMPCIRYSIAQGSTDYVLFVRTSAAGGYRFTRELGWHEQF